MLNTILVCLLAAVMFGGLGYFLSSLFWGTNYSKTDTSGDFGAPRGGFIITLLGSAIGMVFFLYVGKYIFPAHTIGAGTITAMIAGAIGGFMPLFGGATKRQKPDADSKDNDKTNPGGPDEAPKGDKKP
jgi:hypothetical protein